MRVNVRASGHGLHCFTDGPPIFDDGLVLRQVAHGDFVAQRDMAEELDAARPLPLKSDNAHARSLFQINDGDTYVVAGVMQKNSMFHSQNAIECELNFFKPG